MHASGALIRPRRLIAGLLTIALSAAAVISACQTTPRETTPARTEAAPMDSVERGRYLVTVMSCNDCHTPQQLGPNGLEPDMSRMLSGHPQDMKLPAPPELGEGPWGWTGTMTLTAFAGPWGISYAANLTPDSTTGIGAWTEDMFMQSIKTGKHWGTGRPIMPPMPWQWMNKLTDEDLGAIYAYLRTVPPIRNEVPAYMSPPEVAAMGQGGGKS
jgi:mono/diheme cytochrome c family protein